MRVVETAAPSGTRDCRLALGAGASRRRAAAGSGPVCPRPPPGECSSSADCPAVDVRMKPRALCDLVHPPKAGLVLLEIGSSGVRSAAQPVFKTAWQNGRDFSFVSTSVAHLSTPPCRGILIHRSRQLNQIAFFDDSLVALRRILDQIFRFAAAFPGRKQAGYPIDVARDRPFAWVGRISHELPDSIFAKHRPVCHA